MPVIVGIVFILLAAWAVLSLRFCGMPDDINPGLGPLKHKTSDYLAPVKCGPYFLYLHPSFYKRDRHGRGAQRYIVFSVTTTPPEAKVDTIEQLWAYGVAQHTIETKRPDLFGRETHKRTDTRPAMYKEIGYRDYIGDYTCKPYHPFDLQCRDFEPWCDLKPAPVKQPPPEKYVPPAYRTD